MPRYLNHDCAQESLFLHKGKLRCLSATKRMTVSLIVFVTWFLPSHGYAQSPTNAHQFFLPLVTAVQETPFDKTICHLNEQEQRMAVLFTTHPEQKRPVMECNPILARVARARAEDLGRRRYFAHINPDGYGPNYLVRQAGYCLPASYGYDSRSNYIESLGAGPYNADAMWEAWMKSEKHLTHLLGLTHFFAEQSDYGIGFAQVPGSPYEYYWVFISARPCS